MPAYLPDAEGATEIFMFRFNTVTARRLSVAGVRLAFAVALRLMTAALPLHAAEQQVDPPRETPLETARKIESLTAGGFFNPASVTPFVPEQALAPQDDAETLFPSPSSDHGLW